VSAAILVSGAAGFIGMHVCSALLDRGAEVVGVDNLSAYYDPALKRARLKTLTGRGGFRFALVDLAERGPAAELFASAPFAGVVHLAAQPGVRHSLEHPHAYTRDNVEAFLNVLEGCRRVEPRHLVYASSSSVYGATHVLPFSETQAVDHPVSLYAATKKANELMAHCYSHLYGFPATGLRFFTVYGPWGRPDMAPWLFARAIVAGEPIRVFNHGRMQRDFTYIDDVVEGVVRVLDRPAPADAVSGARHAVYNIGNHQPVELEAFITELEQAFGRKASREYVPMQEGDVPATCADTDRLYAAVGFRPTTPLAAGLARFASWYRKYHHIDGAANG
jgi:UDP-glucuronate 4-epimerase